MLLSQSMVPSGKTDAELVAESLGGNRDAFAEIVRRYQTLVCSLAYSATGDLARSEDLAQDTFLAIWRQLSELREPAKLRAWVCGIARHRIQDSIRRHYHEPTHKAQSLDALDTALAPEGQPSDQAVSQDEAAIVWRALEQIPESFREPLILFHRQNQSVAQVAAQLELSEDAVKQRLVRGRKLLQAEVEGLVEGTLRRTTPGAFFTSSVMLALQGGGAMAAKVAAVGAGGFLAGIPSSPATGVGALLIEHHRMGGYEKSAASVEERELLVRHRRLVMTLLIPAIVVMMLWKEWFKRQNQVPWFGPIIPVAAVVPPLLAVGARITATRSFLAGIWRRRGESPVKRSWEYRSALHLADRPFVHIRLGFNPLWTDAEKPVRAWIAIGHVAYGKLFAWGYVAVAPVSVGCFALGVVSVGFCAVGPIAVGGLIAVGIFAVGGVAVGWLASGIVAFGADAACGLQSYASNFALSVSGNSRWVAYARHVDDLAARDFFAHNTFFAWTSDRFRGDRRTATVLLISSLPFLMWEVLWETMKGRRRPN